jgi:hypothetical protein
MSSAIRRIDVPEVYRVPSAVFFGVVPGQQEIGDAPGDANFLRTRLYNHVAAIQSSVLSQCPSAVFELLWPR